jgi:hypothetical protein
MYSFGHCVGNYRIRGSLLTQDCTAQESAVKSLTEFKSTISVLRMCEIASSDCIATEPTIRRDIYYRWWLLGSWITIDVHVLTSIQSVMSNSFGLSKMKLFLCPSNVECVWMGGNDSLLSLPDNDTSAEVINQGYYETQINRPVVWWGWPNTHALIHGVFVKLFLIRDDWWSYAGY